MKDLRIAALVLASASSLSVALPVMAQDTATSEAAPEPSDDGEIVVTAQRRQEKVADVPISITVADQAQLERQQVNTINDLNRIAPSLEIQSAPGQNTGGGGAIRGIGTQTFSAGAIASVGVVVDQVSQGNANIGDLFDVSRIEVLKGPQGTLFGLTTSAGVINITTNAPDPREFSARIRTELSDAGIAGSKFGSQIVQGVVNVPLASNAALRVSGIVNRRQGVNRDALTGKLADTNRYGLRARLLWEPTDDLSFNLIGDYTRGTSNRGGDFFTFVKTGGPGPFFGGAGFDPVGITARLASCGVVVREGNQDFCTSQEILARNKNYGISFQADYDAGPFTLTSISAYRGSRVENRGNNIFRADPLELQITGGGDRNKLDLFSQEFRVSSPGGQALEYTFGAFLSHQKTTQYPSFFNITLTPFPGLNIPIVRSLGAQTEVTDDSLAFFGQATYHVTDAFRLIAGGRYTGTRLSLDRFDLDANAASSLRLNTEKFSYRLGGQYDLGGRTMIYATASRGFKGGQIAVPTFPLLPYIVRPEIPSSYEVGLKSTLFGGLVADINLFYQKIRDFQAQQCIVLASGQLSCTQTNIDGVKSRGAEINFFGKISDRLSLNTGFIFAKATYPKGFIGSDGSVIGGEQLAYAPKYKFTASGEYEVPVSDDFAGFVAIDAIWKSRLRYEANSLKETTFRPHWLVGGRIGVRTADDRFSVAVFGRNLFNVHEPSLLQSDFPYNGAQNIGAIYGPQSFRQLGIQLDGKF